MIMIDRQSMSSALPSVTAPEAPPEVHDAAVRLTLRWAARKSADVTDVGVVCDALGLSLRDALRRSEGQSPPDAAISPV